MVRARKVQGLVGHETDTSGMRYLDTGERFPADPAQRRPCVRCGLPPTVTGADPCIADLPGVVVACCGHGGFGYVTFADGRTFRFVNQTGDAICRMVADHSHDSGPLPAGWGWDDPAQPF